MSAKGRKYNVLGYEEKYFILKNYFENPGIGIKEICESFSIGKTTIRDWLKKIDNDFLNIERLRPQRSRVFRKRA